MTKPSPGGPGLEQALLGITFDSPLRRLLLLQGTFCTHFQEGKQKLV